MKYILTLFLSIVFLSSHSQALRQGEWREHYDYLLPQSVVYAEGKVYVLSNLSMYSYDISSSYKETVGRVAGAGDVEPCAAAYDSLTGYLVVGYKSGAVDVFMQSEIYTEYALKNKIMTGSKNINAVTCYNGYAILATDYGISVYDLKKFEFVDSYFLGDDYSALQIKDVKTDGAKLVAISGSQIFEAQLMSENKLRLVEIKEVVSSLSESAIYKKVEIFNDQIIAVVDVAGELSLNMQNEDKFDLFKTQHPGLANVRKFNNKLYVVSQAYIDIYDRDYKLLDRIEKSEYNFSFIDVAVDSEDGVWIASTFAGLLHDGDVVWSPTGTAVSYTSDLKYSDGKIYCTQGKLWEYSPGRLFVYENEKWQSIFDWNYGAYLGVDINPNNPDEIALASFGTGVIKYSKNEIVEKTTMYNSPMNASLINDSANYNSAVGYDSKGGLWALNYWSDTVLYGQSPEGVWYEYSAGASSSFTQYTDVFVDSRDYKWVSANGDAFLFYEGGTYADKSDDVKKKVIMLDRSGKGLAKQVLCVAEDQDGSIWLGTENGIVVQSTPERYLTENVAFSQITLQDGDFLGTLLYGVRVNAIEVDGGNRKWIGTDGAGLFCVSASGTQQLAHFTVENSPLPDNNISELCINDQTGELFIGTGKGLISYKTEATAPVSFVGDVTVYPNPVHPEYEGKVFIEGLPESASLKISDVSGKLVQDAVVYGGTASWDLTNVHGETVQSGVYLIFCTDEEGEQSFVSKIAVIRDN